MSIASFSLKVAARCNLNCSYCYVFNKGDEIWRSRPAVMSDFVFRAALLRIAEYCAKVKRDSVTIVFHGGEPTLVGVRKMRHWCLTAREELAGLKVSFTIQTNGTLITDEWAELFKEFEFGIGLSVDGSPEIHDRFRVDHAGNASFWRVAKAAEALRRADVPFGVLSVVQLGADALACHKALVGLGCTSLGYMLPHHTYDDITEVRARYGPTPCADFLLPILEHWWRHEVETVKIREFWNMGRLIMGARSKTDTIGNDPYGYIFVESDGTIEGLDILRVCGDNSYETGLNVCDHKIEQIFETSSIHADLLNGAIQIPTACVGCPEERTCGGGFLPHRYSRQSGYNNRSVWCADLLGLFSRMRELMGVDHAETEARRTELAQAL